MNSTNRTKRMFSKNQSALWGVLFLFCFLLANSVESKNFERVLSKKKVKVLLRKEQEYKTGIITKNEKRDFARTFYRSRSSLGPSRVDLKFFQKLVSDRPGKDESSIDTFLIGPDEKYAAYLYEQMGTGPRLRLYEALSKRVLYDLPTEGGTTVQFSDTGASLDVIGSTKVVVFDTKGKRWAISLADLDIKDVPAIRLIGTGDTCLVVCGSLGFNFYRFGTNGVLEWKYPGKFIFDVNGDVIYYSKIDIEGGTDRIVFGAIELISGNELWSKVLPEFDYTSGKKGTISAGLEPRRVLASKHKTVLLLGSKNSKNKETKIVVFDKAGDVIGHATLMRSVSLMSDDNLEEFSISENEQNILIRNQFERIESIKIGNE